MKILVLIALSILSVSTKATTLECASFNIELDETTLKTSLKSNPDGTIIVSYANLLRNPVNLARQEYRDTFALASGYQINKYAAHIYKLSRKNTAGQVTMPEESCRIIR